MTAEKEKEYKRVLAEQAKLEPPYSVEDWLDAMEIIGDMVSQHCETKDDGLVFSCCLSANALAMRFLAEHDRMEIIREHGRSVVAKWKRLEK